jgi:hypothetical protein
MDAVRMQTSSCFRPGCLDVSFLIHSFNGTNKATFRPILLAKIFKKLNLAGLLGCQFVEPLGMVFGKSAAICHRSVLRTSFFVSSMGR